MRVRDLITVLAIVSTPGASAKADDPFDLRVLYAGHPGSPREQDFVSFLKRSFKKVESTDYRTVDDAKTEGYDVVIFDWTSIYPRDKNGKIADKIDHMEKPEPPKLSDAFARPTILIGGPGQNVVRKRKLKIDWLCLCLDDVAHGMATGHEIFRTPLAVNPIIEDVPTPAHYPALASGATLGKTIKGWRVHTKKYPEIDPGLVSDGFVFEDSPDCEIISSGFNAKGPASVALGRQGNFFLWGFAASPSDMTPAARSCFLNAVCYIKRFDGQRPIVHTVPNAFSRGRARMVAHFTKTLFDREAYARMNPELAQAYPEVLERQRKTGLNALEQIFPEAVRKQAAEDSVAYVNWVRDNFEWLRPGVDHYGTIEIAVDDDVKSLGLSNHKVELLDACVAMLERGDRTELARRVLERYTGLVPGGAKDWRDWLESHRHRLFFTEAGGYKFMVAPESLTAPVRPERLPLNAKLAPTHREPVVAEVECTPARVRPGENLTMVVRVEIAPAWHIAAVSGSNGPEVPTSLSLKLPSGVETDGDWTVPESLPEPGGSRSYREKVEFRRRLRVSKDKAPGAVTAACTLGYQACDPFSCRRPTEVTLEQSLEIIR